MTEVFYESCAIWGTPKMKGKFIQILKPARPFRYEALLQKTELEVLAETAKSFQKCKKFENPYVREARVHFPTTFLEIHFSVT